MNTYFNAPEIFNDYFILLAFPVPSLTFLYYTNLIMITLQKMHLLYLQIFEIKALCPKTMTTYKTLYVLKIFSNTQTCKTLQKKLLKIRNFFNQILLIVININ